MSRILSKFQKIKFDNEKITAIGDSSIDLLSPGLMISCILSGKEDLKKIIRLYKTEKLFTTKIFFDRRRSNRFDGCKIVSFGGTDDTSGLVRIDIKINFKKLKLSPSIERSYLRGKRH